MAFDPKVAAGGVAVVAIGGGAGVAIHQGTQASTDTKENPMQLAIKDAGFTLKTIDQKCTEALNGDNYQEAVVACVNEDTFKKRAEKLNLDLLNTENISKSDDTDGTKKGGKQQTLIKTLKGSETNDGSSIVNGAQKIKDFCNSTTPFTKTAKTEDGYKFLKICVKEDEETAGKTKPLATALTKDFGHNKETIRSKMKSANFEEKTDSPCEESKLNEVYDLAKYKKAIKDCAKSKKFKKRAEELGLETMPESGEDNFGTTGGNEVKDRVKSVVKTLVDSDLADGNSAKTKVKTYCNSSNKNIEEATNNEDGKNYLKACTKDKGQDTNKVTTASILEKDFGTNK